MAKPRPRHQRRRTRTGRSGEMVFSKRNYILVIVGLLLVTFGYVIMALDGEVDGFVSLYVAPIFILGGYLEIIYAILWRPKRSAAATATANQ